MRFYSALLCSFFFIINSFAQNEKLIEKYISSYQNYNKFYQEYFYTQFNKTNYFPGENIWFQIYILDKQKEKLSNITKKIYTEFYNADGKLIERMILYADKGLANNVFKIPADYNEENIFLKISTDWSKNYEREYIDKILINVKPKHSQVKNVDLKRVSKIYFFPESGHLIEDVPTRVGVKVVDEFNNGFYFLGEIEDEQGNLIVTFKTNKFGMGSFTFRPKPNKKYRLRQFFDRDKSELYLPEINKKGVLFNVMGSGDQFKLFFRTNKQSDNLNWYHYIIYNNYKVAIGGSFNFNGGTTSLQTIENLDLLRGLNTITLFDNNFNPIGERIFFNSRDIKFNKNIVTVTNYKNKDSVDITIYNKGKDSVYHVAVSILPKESISQFSSKGFLSDYYLSSEIRGQIENPNYYFMNLENNKELDFLLLTQGWRKFEWKNLIYKNKNKLATNNIQFLLETGISLHGKVINKKNNTPLINENITLFYNNITEVSVTDTNGNYTFVNTKIRKNDTIKLLVNSDKRIKKSIYFNDKFTVIDSFIEIPKNHNIKIKPKKIKTIVEENFESNINIYKEGEKLDEIELFSKKNNIKQAEIDTYVNPMDNTTFTKSFYVNKDNVDKFRSVLSYLESLPGLDIVANGSDIKIYSRRAMQQSIISGAKRPLDIYIDNMKMNNSDIETLGLLDLNVVRNVNVNKSGIGYGSESPFGRISIYLNFGAAIYRDQPKNKDDISNVLELIIRKGFEADKKYYTPDYKFSSDDEFYKKYATIHWQPNLSITKKGQRFKVKIPKSIDNYIMIIEGVSEKGNIISLKKVINISLPNN